MRYTPIFRELGGDDAVAKYYAEAALPMLKPPAAQHLAPWEHDEIFQGAEFTTLRKAAKYPKDVFDKILEEFIQTAEKKSIMVAMKTNLKGVERGTAKAQAKFGGDVTQISDVVRATVVVKGDVKDLYDAVAMSRTHLERSGDCRSSTTVLVRTFQEAFGNDVSGTSRVRPLPGPKTSV